MTNDERNFRSSYYEKVGCRSVEEKKSLEILLKEKPWDIVKLKQFLLRFTIPATYRNLLWKVQLGVLPVYTDSHAFVASQRQAQFGDLLHALKVMRIVDNGTPKPHLFLGMFLLETGKLHYDFNLQVITNSHLGLPLKCDVTWVPPDNRIKIFCEDKDIWMDHGISAISETLLQMYEDDIDVYWLAKGFYHLVQQFEKDIPKLVDSTKSLLEREDHDLYKYLQDKYSLDSLPLEKWFNTCFSGVLDESALVKIWDKVCGGSSNILVFVAVTLIVTLRRNLLKCKSIEHITKCLQDIPEETEEVIANKAIELWQHYGYMVPTQNDLSLSKSKPDIHLR